MLKYQRLGASVPEILEKDSISCFAAHEKFLVVGSVGGCIHLLDLNGNESIKLNTHDRPINFLRYFFFFYKVCKFVCMCVCTYVHVCYEHAC